MSVVQYCSHRDYRRHFLFLLLAARLRLQAMLNYAALPKVVLHDHLDGGLRPLTVIELAKERGYTKLPTTDPEALGAWFVEGANKKNLVEYLRGFEHTVALLQDPEAIERVAQEYVEDLVADGVVYAEVRNAPELNTQQGLSMLEVLEATDRGLARGMHEAAAKGHNIMVNQLVIGMRHDTRVLEAAEAALEARDSGLHIVGFDIAGPEAGFPPGAHREAFNLIKEGCLRTTIHAGEAEGVPSIAEAMNSCGAERLGHGVRIIEDITDHEDALELGLVADMVLDRGIVLECCPTSNVQTGAVPTIEEHPIDALLELGFRVTVNTDNRLMSGVSMTSEFGVLADVFGWGIDEFEEVTLNAIEGSFAHFHERVEIADTVILPGFEAARNA